MSSNCSSLICPMRSMSMAPLRSKHCGAEYAAMTVLRQPSSRSQSRISCVSGCMTFTQWMRPQPLTRCARAKISSFASSQYVMDGSTNSVNSSLRANMHRRSRTTSLRSKLCRMIRPIFTVSTSLE